MQYAVFAAYHLSLETSFLADEGASLPKMTVKHAIAMPERTAVDSTISVFPPTSCQEVVDTCVQDDGCPGLKPEHAGSESLSGNLDASGIASLSLSSVDCSFGNLPSDRYHDDLASNMKVDSISLRQYEDLKMFTVPSGIKNISHPQLHDITAQEMKPLRLVHESIKSERIDEDEVSSEYFSATDTYQSILVSFSSRCILKGTVCERSRLLRIKFYGSFDKPLGRYLRDDLFDQVSCHGFPLPIYV